MRRYILLLGLLLSVFPLSAQSYKKFDARSVAAINHYLSLKSSPGAVHVSPVNRLFDIKTDSRSATTDVGAIVTLNDGYSFDDLYDSGLIFDAKLGDDMCVVSGPIEDIIALEENNAVRCISFGEAADAKLDIAREAIGQNMIHDGVGLPSSLTGKDVICGIYDTGVDPNHLNFYNTDVTESRVKAVHHFTMVNGSSIDYTTPEDIRGFGTDSRSGTHGTHTLGCMAGAFQLPGDLSGDNRPLGSFASIVDSESKTVEISSSEKHPYYGMAPESDVVIACGPLYNNNILAGISKIIDYSKATGKPAVVNLSIGQNIGPHDGTDAFCQGLERLGRDAVIFLAAGNEGNKPLSIVKTFAENDTILRTVSSFSLPTSGMIDIWSSDSRPLGTKLVLMNKKTGVVLYELPIGQNENKTLATMNFTDEEYVRDELFDKTFQNSYLLASATDNSTGNNRYNVFVQYSLRYSSAPETDKDIAFGLIISGQPGVRVDVVEKISSGSHTLSGCGLYGWSDASSDLSISSLACGDNVISVGAWCTRPVWPTMTGITLNYHPSANIIPGRVADFSSYGVTINGKILPDIIAPGAGIVSSINSYLTPANSEIAMVSKYNFNNRTYYWSVEQGTSMSSPIVAGAVATWLQYNPDLTVSEVREIIRQTAVFDSDCETAGIRAGGGKFQAYAGLKEVVRRSGVKDISINRQSWLNALGLNRFEIFSPGDATIIEIYNTAGVLVDSRQEMSDTSVVDLNQLVKGVYILRVNKKATFRVLVK